MPICMNYVDMCTLTKRDRTSFINMLKAIGMSFSPIARTLFQILQMSPPGKCNFCMGKHAKMIFTEENTPWDKLKINLPYKHFFVTLKGWN